MTSEASAPQDQDVRAIAEVVPIKAARSGEFDFSDAPIDLSIDYLVSQLRHPALNNLGGLELAAFLESELTPDTTRNPTSLQENLARAIQTSEAFGDEVFDAKYENDMVFRELITALRKTVSARDLGPQRHAALKLTEVRSLYSQHATDHDDEWHDIIERLFT